MRTAILTITLLLAPVLAHAQAPLARNHDYKIGSPAVAALLNGVALNAAAGTRTITHSSRGYTSLRVFVFATRVAYTTVTAQFSCSQDGTNYTRATSRSTSSGASSVYLQTDTLTTSVSASFWLDYDLSKCSSWSIVFGGANAGATDTVIVQATASAGG